MPDPLVSVLLTTRNRKQLLLDCLQTLREQTYPALEVIVADNGSSDGTAEAIRERFPEVRVLAAQSNHGIAGGRNLAEREAQGELLLFLDSDTLLHPGCVAELAAFLQAHSKAGIAVPKMYYTEPADHIWFGGSSINLFTSQTFNEGVNEPDHGQHDTPKPCAHGPTAFMATRACARAVGGHDESYFMTYADMDYAVHAKRLGFEVWYVPAARLWHHLNMRDNSVGIRRLGYNVPLRAYYFSRNRVIFMRKNVSRPRFWLFMCTFFPLFSLYYLWKIREYQGAPVHYRNHLLGCMDAVKFAVTGRFDNSRFTA